MSVRPDIWNRSRNKFDSTRLLGLAGAAALCQGLATVFMFGWISRHASTEVVGRFGLYLVIVSFFQSLDGIRSAIVVVAVRYGVKSPQVGALAAMSLWIAVGAVGLFIVVAHSVLSLRAAEVAPLALIGGLLFACSPGLAIIETRYGAHIVAAIQSFAWATAILGSGWGALEFQDVRAAAWILLTAPLIIALAVWGLHAWVTPNRTICEDGAIMARQGMFLNLATALSGFLDKGTMAVFGGPQRLGAYAPLAELTSRAGALGGMIATLFFRDETRHAHAANGKVVRTGHALVYSAMLFVACGAILIAAVLADRLIHLYLGYVEAEQVTCFRILLATLVINLGAQWAAVRMRAYGAFDFYWPYVASLVIAGLLSLWLVPKYGLIGASMVVLVLRSADVALLYKARRLMFARDLVAISATAATVLFLA
jgi:hypothetical protein